MNNEPIIPKIICNLVGRIKCSERAHVAAMDQKCHNDSREEHGFDNVVTGQLDKPIGKRQCQ